LVCMAWCPPAPSTPLLSPASFTACASNTRQRRGTDASTQAVNPLSPYFLVYIHADGAVRYNFAAPKQVLEIFRALCQGKTEPYADLCKLFDEQTGHGQDMSAYSALLDKTVAAIVAQFTAKTPPTCSQAGAANSWMQPRR
jgi:hypothetical protein